MTADLHNISSLSFPERMFSYLYHPRNPWKEVARPSIESSLKQPSEPKGETAQPAIHFLELGHAEHDQVVAELLERMLHSRETRGHQHVIVHSDAVRRIFLARRNAHEIVVLQRRMIDERIDRDDPFVIERGNAALQVQDAWNGPDVDARGGIAGLGQERRQLCGAFPVRSLRDSDEEMFARLADVAAV